MKRYSQWTLGVVVLVGWVSAAVGCGTDAETHDLEAAAAESFETPAAGPTVSSEEYRPKLGMRLQGEREGYTVETVVPGSRAERAGLQLGDRIWAINGLDLASVTPPDQEALIEALQGDRVEILAERAGTAMSVVVDMLEPISEEVEKQQINANVCIPDCHSSCAIRVATGTFCNDLCGIPCIST